MQKWYRTSEFWRAVFLGGLAMIAQYLPYSIGIPIGIFFALIAAWNLWGLRLKRSAPSKQQRILTRPSLKKAVLFALALAVIAAAVVVVLPIIRQSQESVPTPESPPPESPPPESPQTWQCSHPSPQEISQSIDALPPYLQETARQNYKGLSVTWGVTLFSARDSPDGVRIHAIPSGQNGLSVMFTVDASLYPEIKTMPRGQEFVVQGTITEVSSLWIKLGDCHLIFH